MPLAVLDLDVAPLVLRLLLLVVGTVVLAQLVKHRSRDVPRVAGLLAALVGAVSMLAALSAHQADRFHVVTHTLGSGIPDVAHTLAVPAGFALVLTGRFLAQRHRRALHASIAGLLLLAVLDLLRGPDVLTAAASVALAWVLWRARDAFAVRPLHVRSTALAGAVTRIVVGVVALATLSLAAASSRTVPRPSLGDSLDEAIRLLALSSHRGPPLPELLEWVPTAINVLGVATVLVLVLVVFRRQQLLVRHTARERTSALLQEHGTDTLSGFSLRADVFHHVSADGRAAVAFRVIAGVLMLGGAPAGPRDAVDGLLREMHDMADRHDLRLAMFGATEELAERAAEVLGMRPHYIGDEGVLHTDEFTLVGRPMKKVRQAVQRVERHGYTSEAMLLGEADPATLAGIRRVVSSWGNDHNHGFTLAMDIEDPSADGTVVVLARDETGEVRALVHLVPAPGAPIWSLSTTPYEPGLPNGVVDFLIARTVDAARERGIERVSLNFATMRSWIHDPQTLYQRVMGRIILWADRWLQFERLYRFNQKFKPEWVPRYGLYESRLALPRTLLVLLLIEDQISLPRPAVLRRLAPGAIERTPTAVEEAPAADRETVAAG